jgi:hypothetical protein
VVHPGVLRDGHHAEAGLTLLGDQLECRLEQTLAVGRAPLVAPRPSPLVALEAHCEHPAAMVGALNPQPIDLIE